MIVPSFAYDSTKLFLKIPRKLMKENMLYITTPL